MAKGFRIPSYFVVTIILIARLVSIIGKLRRPTTSLLPLEIQSLDLANRLYFNTDATTMASIDFGRLTQAVPAAVLYPSSIDDIVNLIRFSYNSSTPFNIAARGRGHSLRGQAMALNGVVVDMRSLNDHNIGKRIVVSLDPLNCYVDAGGEQLWIDVLRATLDHGLAPKSWTDYLYLTVGGTLSNAGISGQAFLHGPQISNVYEMDVITGRGEIVTCSKHTNSELFYAVLGGLGQFGIITRARIALDRAPGRVRWVRMLYHDFYAFTRDQEYLISMSGDEGVDYVEGSVMHNIVNQGSVNNWRSSFFTSTDHPRINSIATHYGTIYCLEVVKYYYGHVSVNIVDEELEIFLNGLSYIPGFKLKKDVLYVDFLNRVRSGELRLHAQGLWEVPHPWLNLFVPKSKIFDFNSGVFDGILRNSKDAGPVLIFPMNQNKWDDMTSAVIPDEDVFYSIGLLRSSDLHDWKYLEDQNKEILKFCKEAGIKIKQYLHHYNTKSEWMTHFGSKWDLFQERKNKFDPKAILSPGQRIFTSI
ncbi:hypothetical protein GIB67_041582 [Kingdonia uniflora]|uniref:cytokinin dehydrogenase n=1 Tax=Kingdonia uniflora TaxID=39325 RepID=A0A7J7MQF9_9MAGN|nr:hypothetical protein GIB67_041582 [Kingdonia uniflora]